jgi:protein SCO1/2
MRYFLLISISALLFIACSQPPAEDETPGKLKTYELKGKVLSFDKKTKIASIEHEEIPGFMSAMTMDFEIRKPEWVWNELAPGAQVTADLIVDNKNSKSWLEVKGIVASSLPSDSAPKIREDKASEGKEIPDFTLTNQDGKEISAKDFRGKALAITFIYSECPLPEFCILMSKNFSDIANTIAGNEELKDKIRLLSISFDPQRDTPEKLKSYGLGYLGKDSKAKDFTIWQLAVGEDKKIKDIADFFGLRYEVDEKDKTQFAHSLRTIVVTPDGKVQKVFSGNDWKTVDLIEEMKKTLDN